MRIRLLILGLILVCSSQAFSQSEIITGKISSQDGQPLQGVTVQVKNTKRYAITDSSGNFKIEKRSGDNTLQISSAGYEPKEVIIGRDQHPSIMLAPSYGNINAIVVVGYGTQKKSDVTGSVASVSSQKITEVPVTSPAQALQGRVAGVLVDRQGNRPGDDSKILIRGRRSFKASSDPLFVVDGVPIDAGINDINPNDIESMEVLKDASATAIYGSRGANGVILITTKRGRSGKINVNYDGYAGVQTPLRLAPLLNAASFAEYRREAFRNTYDVNGNSIYPSDTPSKNLDADLFKQDPVVQQNVLSAYDANGVYHPEMLKNTDWSSLVMRTGTLQDHHVSVSGGSDKTKIFFSAGYTQDVGITKSQDFSRYNIKLTIDQEINKVFKIGMSSYYASDLQNYGSDLYNSARSLNPLASPYDSTGKLVFQPGNDGLVYNPIYDIGGRVDERRKYRYLGSFYTEIKLAPGLKYRFNLGLDYGHYRQGEFQSAMSTSRGGGTAYARLFHDTRSNYNLQNLLYYDAKLNKHSFGVTLLQEMQGYRYENSEEKAFDLPYENQLFYNIGSAVNVQGISSNFSQNRLVSFMGRLNYGFDSRYLLTVSLRADGASVLAEGHKFAYFPSAALAWRVSQESFMQNSKLFNDLKFRVGYGRTGNSSISPYQTLGSLSQTFYSWNELPALGFRPNLIPNPALNWETTGQYNVGLDFSLLNSRISGTVDAYLQQTTDLLLDRQLPTASGFSGITQNVGSTSNRGLEVTLSTVNIDSKNGFRWTTDFMFYHNDERIESLYNGKVDDVGNKWFIGHPISVYYDYQKIGIWQSDAKDAALMKTFNANGSNFKPGYIKLADVNGDNKITAADRVILGTPAPKWTGSMNSTFSYKDLDLSVFVYAKQKYMIYADKGIQNNGRYNQWKIDYYTPATGGNAYPRPTAALENPDYQSTMYYEDGSFVKIRNITLGYRLPASLLSRINARSFRIYVSANNAFMFTNSTAMDPENTFGVSTPSVKSFLAGVNIGF